MLRLKCFIANNSLISDNYDCQIWLRVSDVLHYKHLQFSKTNIIIGLCILQYSSLCVSKYQKRYFIIYDQSVLHCQFCVNIASL